MPEPPQPPIAEALEEILPRLPEVFDKNDVIRLLGWNPPRATLFRALQNLIFAGRLALTPARERGEPSASAAGQSEGRDDGLSAG